MSSERPPKCRDRAVDTPSRRRQRSAARDACAPQQLTTPRVSPSVLSLSPPLSPCLSLSHTTQVQKVTPEELEIAIANRDKAILVDFFGEGWGVGFAAAASTVSQHTFRVSPPRSKTGAPLTPNQTHHNNTNNETATPTRNARRAATWCGPCLLLAQELDKVAEDVGDAVSILKLDVDENPELASQLQIAGLPTMIFIGTDDSKPALRSEGLMTAETIKSILRKDLQVEC